MLKSLATAVTVLLIASPALAAPEKAFFECDMAVKRALGWVSPKIGFVFDGKGGVTVIDAAILHFLGKPTPGRIGGSASKPRITWTIANAVDDKGERIPTFSYVANLNLKTGAVRVVAKPVGIPQRFSGKGKCTQRKE